MQHVFRKIRRRRISISSFHDFPLFYSCLTAHFLCFSLLFIRLLLFLPLYFSLFSSFLPYLLALFFIYPFAFLFFFLVNSFSVFQSLKFYFLLYLLPKTCFHPPSSFLFLFSLLLIFCNILYSAMSVMIFPFFTNRFKVREHIISKQ